MNTYVNSSQREKVISGAGAFGMHVLFIALLVFGVNWQRKVEPQANVVDLWTDLPSQAQPKVEPPPPPPPPQPIKPPKIEPVPPPKPIAKPEIAKPDIALKKKAEKERPVVEQRKADPKKQEVAKAAEKEREQQQAKEAADAQQRFKEQQEEDAKRKQAELAAAAVRLAQIDKYKAAIRDKIKRFIVLPPSVQGNPDAEFDVVILASGEVLGVKLKRPSGNAAYDSAVERAILRAQPLPLPPDPALFKEFRELNLRFRPQE